MRSFHVVVRLDKLHRGEVETYYAIRYTFLVTSLLVSTLSFRHSQH